MGLVGTVWLEGIGCRWTTLVELVQIIGWWHITLVDEKNWLPLKYIGWTNLNYWLIPYKFAWWKKIGGCWNTLVELVWIFGWWNFFLVELTFCLVEPNLYWLKWFLFGWKHINFVWLLLNYSGCNFDTFEQPYPCGWVQKFEFHIKMILKFL